MDREISIIDFSNVKKQILQNVDHSKKGSIDEPIKAVLDKINSQEDYVSTSSCSGRIIVNSQESLDLQKKNCHWVYNTHECGDEEKFIGVVRPAKGYLTLKFEPFILHVQARTLDAAKLLLNIGLSTGFRNSGIVLGKHGKVTVAIRSTANLEIPLSDGKDLLVSDEYLKFCLGLCNGKMVKNLLQIKKFEEAVNRHFSHDPHYSET